MSNEFLQLAVRDTVSKILIISEAPWSSWIALVPSFITMGITEVDIIVPDMYCHNLFGLSRTCCVNWYKMDLAPVRAPLLRYLDSYDDFFDVLILLDCTFPGLNELTKTPH